MQTDVHRELTVSFLPHRLNRQPVIVRGLTADELWISVTLSGVCGLMLGTGVAFLTGSVPMVPTLVAVTVAVGLFVGGGMLRRLKRGRPETWLYRQIQWSLCLHLPMLRRYLSRPDLIFHSGYWNTRREKTR